MADKLDIENEMRKAEAKRKQQDEEMLYHCAYVVGHGHIDGNEEEDED